MDALFVDSDEVDEVQQLDASFVDFDEVDEAHQLDAFFVNSDEVDEAEETCVKTFVACGAMVLQLVL